MTWVEVVDDWRGLIVCVLPLTARSLKILISFDVIGDGIYSKVCCSWLVMEFIQKYAAIDGDGIYSKVCCNWLVMGFIQKYAAIDGEKDDSDD